MQTLKDVFDAETITLPFKDLGTVKKINSWVDDKTHHKILSVLDNLNPSDTLLLVNCAYFKGRWDHQFDKGATEQSQFLLPTGANKSVYMMHLSTRLQYMENDKYKQLSYLIRIIVTACMYFCLKATAIPKSLIFVRCLRPRLGDHGQVLALLVLGIFPYLDLE